MRYVMKERERERETGWEGNYGVISSIGRGVLLLLRKRELLCEDDESCQERVSLKSKELNLSRRSDLFIDFDLSHAQVPS